ncbi:hypothetical protein TGARI_295440 [Toxoplasma gondii ARI]|uniref:Transmembrane protein n=1 Tax=Toxoplasma gondii ARI TaxID=1074872 RepID=A0A139XJW3_TOXGO|nr:hypothetical protein TGARI_295440 [Toxoplasma gondii ARI]
MVERVSTPGPAACLAAGVASFSTSQMTVRCSGPFTLNFKRPPCFGRGKRFLMLAFLGVSSILCAGISPRLLGVSAGSPKKSFAEEAVSGLGLHALHGLLSQLGELAKNTTSAVRRSVHRSLSEARQTDAFKSLKYAMNREPVMTEEGLEEELSALGHGMIKYLARVDTVHPRERQTVLTQLIQKDPTLLHVLFKYTALEGFADVSTSFSRLKDFSRSFEDLLKIQEDDDVLLESGSERSEVESDKVAGDGSGKSADEKASESPTGNGKRRTRRKNVRGKKRPRKDVAELTASALKLFEAELSTHLSYLTDLLSKSPEDAEALKLYVRRMVPRLKQAFRAAWQAASTQLGKSDGEFHLRYLTDYLREFGVLDTQLGRLSEILPSSQPPFNPENHYYGTPSITPWE